MPFYEKATVKVLAIARSFSPPQPGRSLIGRGAAVRGVRGAETTLGLGNNRGARRRCGLRVLRSRWGFHCAAAIDDILRVAAIRGARSRAGARVPERIHCVAGLCRGR
jgi:hypothetical protein